MEEALGYQRLMDTFYLTQEEVAKRLGKSRSAVANALRLLKLPKPVRELVKDQKLSSGHARALLALENPITMESLAEKMIADGCSVREAETIVKRQNNAWKKNTPQEEKAMEKELSPRREAFFDEVQLSLEQTLGRKIKVSTVGQNESGTLVIDFFDQEDLKNIANMLEQRDQSVTEYVIPMMSFQQHEHHHEPEPHGEISASEIFTDMVGYQ
jgi:ParB family chromosome partitioning protein